MSKDKIVQLLTMYKEEEMELEDVVQELMNILDSVKIEKEMMSEEKQEMEEIEKETEKMSKDNKDEEEKEVIKYSKQQIYKGKIGGLEDKRILEAVKNTKHKIPLNLEHIPSKVVGEVVDLAIENGGIYAYFKVNKDFKENIEDYYLSAELLVLQEEDEEMLVLQGIALTQKPALPVEKIEKVPAEIYSSYPKIIKKLIYTHPEVLTLLKNKKIIPAIKTKEEKEVKSAYDYLLNEERILNTMFMI